jgi:hypothetical protein
VAAGILEEFPAGLTLVQWFYDLLAQVVGEEEASTILNSVGVEILACVVDTNILINDVKYVVQTHRVSALLEAVAYGSVRFYASTTVRDEVVEKLPVLAAKQGFDLPAALDVWGRYYCPWITFVDPSEMPFASTDVRLLAGRDSDDVATGQIIDLVRPHAALSWNTKHLSAFQPTGEGWIQVTRTYREKSQGEAVGVGIYLGGGAAVGISSEVVRAIVGLISRLDRKILVVGGCAAFILITGALAIPVVRARLKAEARRLSPRAAPAIGAFGELVSAAFKIHAQGKRARRLLQERRLNRRESLPHRSLDYLVYVLAHSPAPISVSEIMRRMTAAGYRPRGRDPDPYISRLLRRNPSGLFEDVGQHRWRIKSHLN